MYIVYYIYIFMPYTYVTAVFLTIYDFNSIRDENSILYNIIYPNILHTRILL